MVKRIQKKERLTRRLVPVVIFLATFNLLAIPLYIGIYTNFSFDPLKELNARMVSATLNFFGYNTHPDGSMVNLVSDDVTQKIDISWDSTGWKSMYAIAALIMSTPISKISRRMKFALVGVASIFLINYIRLVTTILISVRFGFDLFDIIHTVLWREGLILAVVGIWLVWVRMEKYNIGKTK
ncbi:MAG: archaeosortase/exosortase family protein [Candidatus Aenigmarchaeota archaeon]|nr:archaeosortase/exosortase family protein [Candidatus Aenigmarchaeota archaeon]